ncbi:MAG: cyclohexanone monooxygenase [Rhodospirillaceae bacterium]|nr:cyclohexanone monooxygenase [Rhodospirillaceae bacterium]
MDPNSKANQPETTNPLTEFDAVIIGAGFAGMYMLHKLRQLGLTCRVFEKGSGVGGTWYWNRYPGARCDVESMQYSYQFSEELQQEWEWTEKYSPQPEILKYANHVADRFELRRDIQFNTQVVSATFDEDNLSWDIQTNDKKRVRATFCIMATGCLSSPNTPKFTGLDSFSGDIYHTGKWPHSRVSMNNRKVGIIGTGSSAIQSIPELASEAAQLFVFQRTANYTIPARNAPLEPEEVRAVKADYAGMRARAKTKPAALDVVLPTRSAIETEPKDRVREYEERWSKGGVTFLAAFKDILLDAEANDTAASFVREKIRETVKNPEIAKLLAPTNIIGCKRICVDTDYWDTFNQKHVELIDVNKTPIKHISPNGIVTSQREFEIDTLVLATGFDAMTGALLKIDIRGRKGIRLQEKWAEGPKSYLGLSIAEFPNMFTITGPGSPSVLTNMLPSIEQHVEWISGCIEFMNKKGIRCIEAEKHAEEDWVKHVNEVADLSLRSTCSSWYVGANIEGKARVFMPYIGGFPKYVEKCTEVVKKDYEGYSFA